jgi:hypothetical protein
MNEVIESIISLLRTTLWSTYKKYFYGEVHIANKAYMPYIEVVPMGTRAKNRGTWWMMDNEYQVRVTIKHSLKSYLKENTNVEIIDHVQDLVEKMEGRTSWNVDSNTVLGVLHDNLKLSDTAHINGDWEISYDEIELEDRQSYIVYASVLFTVKRLTF